MEGTRSVIIDASAIVAIFSRRDQWHTAALPLLTRLPKPFVTCEAVLSEACFLLGSLGVEQLFEFIRRDLLRIDFSLTSEAENAALLMEKYSDVPMSLADACLVRMSEMARELSVFTFDRDFQIYRRHGRESIPLVGLQMC